MSDKYVKLLGYVRFYDKYGKAKAAIPYFETNESASMTVGFISYPMYGARVEWVYDSATIYNSIEAEPGENYSDANSSNSLTTACFNKYGNVFSLAMYKWRAGLVIGVMPETGQGITRQGLMTGDLDSEYKQYPFLIYNTLNDILYWGQTDPYDNKILIPNPSYAAGDHATERLEINSVGGYLPTPSLADISSMKIVPEPITLTKNSSIQLSVEVEYDDGSTEPIPEVSWSIGETEDDTALELDGISIQQTGLLVCAETTRGSCYVTATAIGYGFSATSIVNIIDVAPYPPNSSGPGGNGGGGSGSDGDSVNIRPLVPGGSAGPDTSNVGLYTRYLMTASQIKEFGDYLYADDIVESITQGIMKALFDSPAEAVISLMHYPFDVSSLASTSGSQIYYGNINTGKSSSGIMNRSSARIEWGVLPLTEYWGNFLDYAPHTKIDLYLPWCTGSVPIDPHECLPGTLEVITNIEFDKGTCVHNVIGNKGALIGTYSGVVGTQIPVTALDTAGKALSFVTAAVSGIVAAGATGASMAAGSFASQRVSNAMGFAAANSVIPPSTSQIGRAAYEARIAAERPYTGIQRGAGRVAATSSAAAFRVPPNITRNGSFSGNGASLAVQVPFIIISRPTQSVPQNYGRHYGYPSNIYASLGSLVGYTEVGSVHLDGFTCTVEERNEIGELLMGGVVL